MDRFQAEINLGMDFKAEEYCIRGYEDQPRYSYSTVIVFRLALS